MSRSTQSSMVRPDGPTQVPKGLASKVAGNASIQAKEVAAKWLYIFGARGNGFADSVGKRVEIIEVSVDRKRDEPEKLEAKVVCEIDVTEDMINASKCANGGCIIFLIDICSTLPICALGITEGGDGAPGVSQAINTVFHAPAPLGVKLRLINTTIMMGGPTHSARTEVWDTANDRLVASGVQVKMEPSRPKL